MAEQPRVIEVPARPAPFAVDPNATAVVVVDMQNDFASRGGIVPELTPHAGDVVLYKTRYSGFFGTELDELLRRRGVERLIVVGATISVCVESTVRDAMFRDYHCLVVSDATAEPIAADSPRSNHEASLLTLELLFSHVAVAADVVVALRTAAALPG